MNRQNRAIGLSVVAGLVTGLVAFSTSVSKADLTPPVAPTICSSIAQARKLCLDAWNNNEPYAPYVQVTGTITSAPNGVGSGGYYLSSSYLVIQDSTTVGTVLGDGKTYSNAIKVFFGSNPNAFPPSYNPATDVLEGDLITVKGAVKVYHTSSSPLGMEIEIDCSMYDQVGPPAISTPYDASISLISPGSPLAPVPITLSSLPTLGGMVGGNNIATRNLPANQPWYDLPSPTNGSPYNTIDDPYQHMLVTISNVRKWSRSTSGATPPKPVTGFLLSDITTPSNTLKVRVNSTTGLNDTNVFNGNVDPVTGIYETRQFLVGTTPYVIGQLAVRYQSDCPNTTAVTGPVLNYASTFVDVTTPNRTRLPGTSATLKVGTNSISDTVQADLSAFGLGTVTFTPPGVVTDPHTYALTIPVTQAPGQYICPVTVTDGFTTVGGDILINVAKSVNTISETYGLPDDLYVAVSTPKVVVGPALAKPTSEPDTNPTFQGFKDWIWVAEPCGYRGLLLFGWPWGGSPGSRTQYTQGKLIDVFGSLSTYHTNRELVYPSSSSSATFVIDTGSTAPVPATKFTLLRNIKYQTKPSLRGTYVRFYGTVSTAPRLSIDNNNVFYVTDASGGVARVRANWRNVGPTMPFTRPADGAKVQVQGFLDQYWNQSDPSLGWDSPYNTIYPVKQSDITVY